MLGETDSGKLIGSIQPVLNVPKYVVALIDKNNLSLSVILLSAYSSLDADGLKAAVLKVAVLM